jgi:hypothetical protein
LAAAADERVVLGEALPQRRRLLDEIGTVAGLGAQERRFEAAGVAQSLRAAVTIDLILTDGEHFRHREAVRHVASFSYSSA